MHTLIFSIVKASSVKCKNVCTHEMCEYVKEIHKDELNAVCSMKALSVKV